MSEYRFFVNEHDGNGEPTIYRARLYDMHDTGDTWQYYWNGDLLVAVYNDRDYRSPTRESNPEWTERAEIVLAACRAYDQDSDDALNRLAVRLFDHDAPNARFIAVGLDRGLTLYALSGDGDPEGTWADEIEAVAAGDVWRIEVEEWMGDLGWGSADFDGSEWYGESTAKQEFEKSYPLAEFPAHLIVPEVGA